MAKLCSREVKPYWWCIEGECKCFSERVEADNVRSFKCAHKDLPMATRVTWLSMCPYLVNVKACLGHKE